MRPPDLSSSITSSFRASSAACVPARSADAFFSSKRAWTLGRTCSPTTARDCRGPALKPRGVSANKPSTDRLNRHGPRLSALEGEWFVGWWEGIAIAPEIIVWRAVLEVPIRVMVSCGCEVVDREWSTIDRGVPYARTTWLTTHNTLDLVHFGELGRGRFDARQRAAEGARRCHWPLHGLLV